MLSSPQEARKTKTDIWKQNRKKMKTDLRSDISIITLAINGLKTLINRDSVSKRELKSGLKNMTQLSAVHTKLTLGYFFNS